MFFREAILHMRLKMVCWKVRDTQFHDKKRSINTSSHLCSLYQIKSIRFWTRAATTAMVVIMTNKTTVPAVRQKKLWSNELKGQIIACHTSQRCKLANLPNKNTWDRTQKPKTKSHASQTTCSPKFTPSEVLNFPVALLKTVNVAKSKPTFTNAAQVRGTPRMNFTTTIWSSKLATHTSTSNSKMLACSTQKVSTTTCN